MLTGKTRLPQFTPLPPDRRPAKGFWGKAAGAYVPKLTAKAFERFGFHSAEIMMNWPRIAGADIAAMSQPERIRWPRNAPLSDQDQGGTGRSGATLILRVEPARALDIEYRAQEIMERINRYFGYAAVSSLKILQAPLRDEVEVQAPALMSRAPTPPAPPLPANVTVEPDVAAALNALWANVASRRQKP
jgi:hypothetical protein